MKKIIIYYILFVFGYILLIIITSPFLVTWGQKRGVFENLYVWFLTKPIDLNYSPWLIILNAIFWATVFYFIKIALDKMFTMLKRN